MKKLKIALSEALKETANKEKRTTKSNIPFSKQKC